MKKFVVLTLVLAMASLACALPTLSGVITAGGTGTIDVTVGTEPEGDVLIWTDSYGVYSGRLLSVGAIEAGMEGAFTLAQAHPDYAADIVKMAYNDDTTGDTTPGGLLFSFVVDGAGLVAGTQHPLTLMDANFGELGTVMIDVIPEPMTLGLLGLGGLFLRRKK